MGNRIPSCWGHKGILIVTSLTNGINTQDFCLSLTNASSWGEATACRRCQISLAISKQAHVFTLQIQSLTSTKNVTDLGDESS